MEVRNNRYTVNINRDEKEELDDFNDDLFYLVDTNNFNYDIQEYNDTYNKIIKSVFFIDYNSIKNNGLRFVKYLFTLFNITQFKNPEENIEKINLFTEQIIHIESQLKCLREIGDIQENDYEEHILTYNKIREIIFYTESTFKNLSNMTNVFNKNYDSSMNNDFLNKFSLEQYNEMTNKQKVIDYLMSSLYLDGLKRKNGMIYEKIFYKDNFTYTWKEKESISNFMYRKCSQKTNYEQWSNLTKSSFGEVEKFLLENIGDDRFNDIETSRYVFSYNNGLHFIRVKDNNKFHQKFISYNYPTKIKKLLKKDVYSIKYFNKDYPEELNNTYWKDIETPNFDKIFSFQLENRSDYKEIYNIILALYGRLLYELNSDEHDNWQIMLFLKGTAGTGKSTFLSILNRIYNPSDIGIIENNIEEKFGLQTIYKKVVAIGTEIKTDFSLGQGEFQTMISGEGKAIKIKGNNTIDIKWNVPMIMAGNELPGYADSGGSISRRLALVSFHNILEDEDTETDLDAKIIKELPFIITKIVGAYLETLNKYKLKSFWDFAPKYFNEQKINVLAETNSIVKFLLSDEIIYDENSVILISDIGKIYNDFCKENSIISYKKLSLNIDNIKNPLKMCGKLRNAKCVYKQNIKNNWYTVNTYNTGEIKEKIIFGDFIKGIKLKEEKYEENCFGETRPYITHTEIIKK